MMESNIYSPEYVSRLFEQMSETYDRVNRVTSFGFSTRWRRQCVQLANLQPGMTVVDFMTGMGEAWPFILSSIGEKGHLTAIDICPSMIRLAEKRRQKFLAYTMDLLKEDALKCSLPNHYADAAIATFGLKTFSKRQTELFATELWRVLKPDAAFSLIEISLPPNSLLATPYLFYLKKMIPRLGRLFLGNPNSYRMLGVYTEKFRNCLQVKTCFEEAGFQVQYRRFFGGCASGLVGKKPA